MRQKLKRWADDLDLDQLNDDPVLPDELNDRAQDNSRHLVGIADLAGSHWPKTVRHALVVLHAARTDDGPGVMLIRDIRAIFLDWPTGTIRSNELIEQLWKQSPEWSEYKGRPITAKGVARLLRPFGISAVRDRHGSYYVQRDFEDAWRRYL